MFDWQRFIQQSTAMIAHSERKKFTGHTEFRIFYVNAKPRRGLIRKLTCPVLSREPIADRNRLLLPAEMIRNMEDQLPNTGFANENSEIAVFFQFSRGFAVDIRTELIQNL